MAQQEVDKHWTMYEDLETEIKVLHDTIMKAFEEKRAPDVINNLTQEKERLIVRQKEVMDQMAILYSCHADLVALNQGGLLKSEPLSISDVNTEHWNRILSKGLFEYQPWLKEIVPISKHTPKAFQWNLTETETSQSNRYLPFLQEELHSVLGPSFFKRIQIVNGNDHENCLATKGLQSVIGYDFQGTIDVFLALRGAGNVLPEIGSVGALKLKKGDFTREDVAQANAALLVLNAKARHMRPWVLLTDLNSYFNFYWMDDRTMYFHTTDDPSVGWGVLQDLLQHDARVTLREPTEEETKRNPILSRREAPALLQGHAVEASDDVANLADVMDEDELGAYLMLRQLAYIPAIAPYL